MNMKIIGLFAAVALLSACSDSDTTAATGGAGGGATPGGAAARPGSQEDLVANVGDRVLFGFDSATLDGQARGIIGRQAAWLKQYPQNQVQIEGHADERGTREYNLALGQRRANAARDALVAGGIAGSRISTISYGKDRPAALGSDESAWAQNRRAVTVVR